MSACGAWSSGACVWPHKLKHAARDSLAEIFAMIRQDQIRLPWQLCTARRVHAQATACRREHLIASLRESGLSVRAARLIYGWRLCSFSGLAVVQPIRCPRGAVPSLLRGGLEHMQAGRFISTHFCPREGGVHGPVCVCMRMQELRVRSASAAHAGGSAPIHVHAALLWQTECWSTSSHHRTTTFKSERCHKQSRPCCSCLTSVHVNPH